MTSPMTAPAGIREMGTPTMSNPVVFIATPAVASIAVWHAAAGERCASPDNVTSVSGTGHCLQIQTYMPPAGSARTLVVVLHGALSRGGGGGGAVAELSAASMARSRTPDAGPSRANGFSQDGSRH